MLAQPLAIDFRANHVTASNDPPREEHPASIGGDLNRRRGQKSKVPMDRVFPQRRLTLVLPSMIRLPHLGFQVCDCFFK